MIQRWDLIDNYIKHGYFDFVYEQIFGPEIVSKAHVMVQTGLLLHIK